MYYVLKKIAFIPLLAILLSSCKQSLAPDVPPTPLPLLPPEAMEQSPSEIENGVWNTNDVDVSYIQTDKKLISFTFDDSPSRLSENLLVAFARFNELNPDCKATATIFYNGYKFDATTTHLLHGAYALGFELGNHSYSHYNLTTLSKAELEEEIRATDRLLEKVDNKPYHLFRAPFGNINELVKETVSVPILNWSIDTLDWQGKSADEIYESIYTNRFDGAIVLMHDGYQNTVDAVKRLLPDLKADGYQVVSVSALAKMHNCTMKQGSVYIRLRKQA